MFRFENISKEFKKDFWDKGFYALDDVSFEIKPGRVTGFLGANGAGKTTSIKILMGFIESSSGRVIYDDGSMNSNKFREKVGYLPERPYFYPHLTGNEFIQYISKIINLDKKVMNQRIDHWAEKFKIKFALDRKIHGYSKGMLQRLGFVVALIGDPQLIVLDEPVAGLDPIGRKEIKDVMHILREEGKTIFFSSHIVNDVEEVSDDLVILEKGKLVYNGDTKSLIENSSGNKRRAIIKSLADIGNFPFKILSNRDQNEIQVEIQNDQISEFIDYISKNKIDLISLERELDTLENIVYDLETR